MTRDESRHAWDLYHAVRDEFIHDPDVRVRTLRYDGGTRVHVEQGAWVPAGSTVVGGKRTQLPDVFNGWCVSIWVGDHAFEDHRGNYEPGNLLAVVADELRYRWDCRFDAEEAGTLAACPT